MAEACCPPPLTRGSGSGPRWLSSGDAWVCRPVMPGMRLLSTMGALIMMLRSWDTRRMCGEGQQLVARSRRDHVLQWLQADPYWSELGRLQAFRCMALSEEEFKHEEGGYTGRQAPGCKTCNAIDMGHRLQATRVSAWARCFLQLNRRWLIQLTKGVRTALHTLPQEELRGSGNHFFSHCFSDTALTYGVIQVMNDPEHFDGGATRAIERAIPNWDRVIEEVLEGQKLKEWRSTLETFYSPWLVLGRVQLPVRHPSHHNQRRPSHLRHQWAHHNQRRPSHLCHQWAHHQLPWWLDQLPVRCPSHQHLCSNQSTNQDRACHLRSNQERSNSAVTLVKSLRPVLAQIIQQYPSSSSCHPVVGLQVSRLSIAHIPVGMPTCSGTRAAGR